MQKKYIIRNIHGGIYTNSRDKYYPYIDSADPNNITIHNSEQDALDDISIIISQYMNNETPAIEIVPIYTI